MNGHRLDSSRRTSPRRSSRDEVIRPIDRPFSASPRSWCCRHGCRRPETRIPSLGVRGPDRQAHVHRPCYRRTTTEVEAIRPIRNRRRAARPRLVVRGWGSRAAPAWRGPRRGPLRVVLDAAGLRPTRLRHRRPALGLCLKGIPVAEVSPEPRAAARSRLVQTARDHAIDSLRAHARPRVPRTSWRADARLGAQPTATLARVLSIYQRSVQPMSTASVLVGERLSHFRLVDARRRRRRRGRRARVRFVRPWASRAGSDVQDPASRRRRPARGS